MKKAEIIKNGNVNLKPIKTGIDWDKIENQFHRWRWKEISKGGVTISRSFEWLKKRIEKELNSSE